MLTRNNKSNLGRQSSGKRTKNFSAQHIHKRALFCGPDHHRFHTQGFGGIRNAADPRIGQAALKLTF